MHPYLLQLGHLSLPTFGAMAALGLMLALWLSQRTAPRAGVDPDRLWDAGVFAVVAAFVISRLLLLVEHFESFRRYPALLLAVPALTASGLLATVVVTLGLLWWQGVPVLRALDAWTPCGLMVWAFLALGHFMEGSDPGMESRLGVRLSADDSATHPVALYACVVAAWLTWLSYREPSRQLRAGRVCGVGLGLAGLAQFLLSFLRLPGDDAGLGLDGLQWVALGMMVCGALLVTFATGKMRAA